MKARQIWRLGQAFALLILWSTMYQGSIGVPVTLDQSESVHPCVVSALLVVNNTTSEHLAGMDESLLHDTDSKCA